MDVTGGRLIVRTVRRDHRIAVLVTLTTLFALLIASVAAAAPLPKRPTPGSLPKGAPPSDEEGATTTAPLRSLSLGERGEEVMTLQRQLRRKGVRVSVDGAYGPATRAAVRRMQRKLDMRATGIATVAFLRKLGLTALPGAATVGTPVAVTGGGRYLKAFPVGGTEYQYTNSFGDARHQGAHQGVDIIAPKGVPIVSATYGRIQRLTRVETGLGGLWIWIVDRQGNEYYYAHLNSIATGLQEGTEVWPGRVIGTNGNTGDARYGVEHLHFELHPGGGGAISPYSDLVAVDKKRKAQSAITRARRAAALVR